MKRKIYKISNPTQWNILTRPSDPVKKFDRNLRRIVRDMFETMYDANGIGLAAPQIGLSLCIVVLDTIPRETKMGNPIALINPEITRQDGMQEGEEGCLSIPNLKVLVLRPTCITVNYQTESGAKAELLAEDILARAICHEIDHLNGRLITDYVIQAAMQ